jgi:hypothetical protein
MLLLLSLLLLCNASLDVFGFSEYSDDQVGWVNFALLRDIPSLDAAASAGVENRIIYSETIFVTQGTNSLALIPNLSDGFTQLSSLLGSRLTDGTVSGLYVGDELLWRGLPFADFVTLCDALKAQYASLLLISVEASTVWTDNVDVYNNTIGSIHIPASLDWYGVDWYFAPASQVEQLYTSKLYPASQSTHRFMLIPGSFVLNVDLPTYPESFFLNQAYDAIDGYIAWALRDSRVNAVIVYHWIDYIYTTSLTYDEFGTSSYPQLVDAWHCNVTEARPDLFQACSATALSAALLTLFVN